MYAIQLDLFKTPEQCEMDALRLKISAMQITLDKVRKGGYAGHNENRRDILNHEERLSIIERYICRGV